VNAILILFHESNGVARGIDSQIHHLLPQHPYYLQEIVTGTHGHGLCPDPFDSSLPPRLLGFRFQRLSLLLQPLKVEIADIAERQRCCQLLDDAHVFVH
jgi:hypothetical protein